MDRRNTYTPRSAQEQFIVPLLASRIQAMFRDFAPHLGPEHRVLDVGCGEQPLRAELEANGAKYTSTDVQQNKQNTVDVLAFIDGQLPEELVGRGPFDFVVCTEVLEHVADWTRAFQNFQRLLAPGGRLLVTCPQVYMLHEIPHDYWRPTIYALRYFAKKEGFLILHEEAAGDGLDVLGTAIACCVIKPAGRGALSLAVAAAANLFRKACFVLVRSQIIRRHLATEPYLYLSNIFVFERPQAGAPGD